MILEIIGATIGVSFAPYAAIALIVFLYYLALAAPFFITHCQFCGSRSTIGEVYAKGRKLLKRGVIIAVMIILLGHIAVKLTGQKSYYAAMLSRGGSSYSEPQR